MSNSKNSIKTGGVLTLAIGMTMATASTFNIDVDASLESKSVEKIQSLNHFKLFENDRPTIQTSGFREISYEDKSLLETGLLAWANSEMDNFMNNLHDEFLFEYPEELMSLAAEIIANNPNALKDF